MISYLHIVQNKESFWRPRLSLQGSGTKLPYPARWTATLPAKLLQPQTLK